MVSNIVVSVLVDCAGGGPVCGAISNDPELHFIVDNHLNSEHF